MISCESSSATKGDKMMQSLFLFSFCCFLSSICSRSGSLFVLADDGTISWGSSLSGNQTIVSEGGTFELGFFQPGSPRNAYIGIWYRGRPETTVVWVANRETPVDNTNLSELTISDSGDLVILNQFKTLVWSSSSTSSMSPKSAVAVLLDTGNLVLRERLNSSMVYWQSFDHPTDTWLPGSRVGWNKLTGEYMTLTSWKNREDPAPGLYSFGVDRRGINQVVQLWNMSLVYFASGAWNEEGKYFSLMPEMARDKVFNYSFDEQQRYLTYTITDKNSVTRFVVDVSGKGLQLGWVNNGSVLVGWSQPRLECDVPFLCGAFSACTDGGALPCACLPGFDPAFLKDWNSNYWNGGCRRRIPLQCGSLNGSTDGFKAVPNVQLSEKSKSVAALSAEDCESSCLKSCSCSAYSYNGSRCSIWNGDIFNLRQSSENISSMVNVYIRLAASELALDDSKSAKKMVFGVVIGVVLGPLLLISFLFFISWRLRIDPTPVFTAADDSTPILFTYRDLKRFTKKFSERLGGGGFGSVFKGIFPDSTTIAVKKLEGFLQGEKQFRTEVASLCTIQHVNLVRLLGFCVEGDNRLLVYEYMPNGSLDSHLLRDDTEVLDWTRRYRIALGVARGLAYLHEECRVRILHCDIKPENILLNADFHPKVADFGMAKLVGHNLSRVLTTITGTIGYLAPEWLSGHAINAKADVYSFGMVLFEIISGKRNTEKNENEGAVFFPFWAAKRVNEGECLSLLDERLNGDANVEELRRLSRVACWCIQDAEACRPSMGKIVQILEGVVEVGVPPVPRTLHNLLSFPNGVY